MPPTSSAKMKFSLGATVVATLQLMANPAVAQRACQPLKTSAEYIARRFPHFDPAGLKQVVSERGSLWEFTYELPQDMLGGAPIITIDKRTCTIVRAIHTQ